MCVRYFHMIMYKNTIYHNCVTAIDNTKQNHNLVASSPGCLWTSSSSHKWIRMWMFFAVRMQHKWYSMCAVGLTISRATPDGMEWGNHSARLTKAWTQLTWEKKLLMDLDESVSHSIASKSIPFVVLHLICHCVWLVFLSFFTIRLLETSILVIYIRWKFDVDTSSGSERLQNENVDWQTPSQRNSRREATNKNSID